MNNIINTIYNQKIFRALRFCSIKLSFLGIVLALLSGIAFSEAKNDNIEEKYAPIIFFKDNPKNFFLVGMIGNRTELNFKRAIKELGVPDTLFLVSPGGSVHIALSLALEIDRLNITTIIPPDQGCYSACSFIFLAGGSRNALGELGVHQISSESPDLISSQITVADIIDVLNLFNTPPELYVKMLNTPPDEMYILNDREIIAMGFAGIRTRGLNSSSVYKNIYSSSMRSSLESQALLFVQKTLSFKPTPANNISTQVKNIYAPAVYYHGNFFTHEMIIKDNETFAKRWPTRNYALDLSDAQTECHNELSCNVSGKVIWSASSTERDDQASGESRVSFSLIYEGNTFKITQESSVVTRRSK